MPTETAPQTVQPTRDIPFFVNNQVYEISVPTPNGAQLPLKPGEVVIGAYFNKCVDRHPAAEGGNRSVTPIYEAVQIDRIKDPLNLLDDLTRERKPRKRSADVSDVRGERALFRKTRSQWQTYLGRVSDDQVMQEFGDKTGRLRKIAKFLRVEYDEDDGKLHLVEKLKTWAAEQ
jgi:hypothetical protein